MGLDMYAYTVDKGILDDTDQVDVGRKSSPTAKKTQA